MKRKCPLPLSRWHTFGRVVFLALIAGACRSTTVSQPVARGFTSEMIAADALRALVAAFAADSMLGRQAGTEGGARAERFLAVHARRIGLLPAGEGGTYFQAVPLVRYRLDTAATRLSVASTALRLGDDFVPFPPAGEARPLVGAEAVFGGTLGEGDSLSAEAAVGRVVVLFPSPTKPSVVPEFSSGPLSGAAAVVLVSNGPFQGYVSFLQRSRTPFLKRPRQLPNRILATRAAAERMLGVSLDGGLVVGTTGQIISGNMGFRETPMPSRNVIAILPGSDPRLRREHVILGAHSDHLGITRPVDHDSIKTHSLIAERRRRSLGGRFLTSQDTAAVRVTMDSLREIRPARVDSIHNGADDNASGAMAVLAIAEALARAPERPRRTVVFLWPTAEEIGLRGSTWFVEQSTIPLESVIVYVNLDMIGRGEVDSSPGDSATPLRVVGSRQRSTELGALVEAINTARAESMRLVYADRWDEGSLPFCRSDHLPFAIRGVPIVFFTTGEHPDYHEVTDEAQYIDYAKMESKVRFIRDVVVRLAVREQRPRIDKPPLDIARSCRMGFP